VGGREGGGGGGGAVADDDCLAADRVGDASGGKERVGEVADVHVAAAAHCEHGAGLRA